MDSNPIFRKTSTWTTTKYFHIYYLIHRVKVTQDLSKMASNYTTAIEKLREWYGYPDKLAKAYAAIFQN